MSAPTPRTQTTVMLVDDQPLVRQGIGLMLSTAGDLTVVGETADGREAVRMEAELRPDVVVMDIRMPVLDGITATREILDQACGRDRRPGILVLTTFDDDEYVYEALAAGASGFLLKDASTHEVVHAVRVVARGDALLAPTVTRRLVADITVARRQRRAAPSTDLPSLTPREVEIIVNLAHGRSNAELAEELFVTEQTIKTHVRNILGKLHLRDRTQIVVFAYENQLVTPGQG